MQIDRALTAITTQLHGVPLKSGQTLAAIVLKADAATGKALLSLAGGQVAVQTNQVLTAGSAIRLTVKDAGPPLVLTLAKQTAGEALNHAPVPNLATNRAINLTPNQPSHRTLIQTLAGQLFQRLSTAQTEPAASGSPPTTASSSQAPSTLAPALPPQLRAVLTSIDALLAPNKPNAREPAGTRLGEQNLGKELARLVATLSLPAASPATTSAPLPPNLKDELHRAAQQIKQAATLDTLKSTQPKAQTEQAAHSQPTPAEASTKASPPNPSEASLQATLDQWLNRLDVSQLRTALQQLQGQPAWMLDVPVLIRDQPQRLQLAISEDNTHPENPANHSTWQLDFALNLPKLGALHASLRLTLRQQNQNDLTVRLYADTPQAQTELTTPINELAEHLRAAGLTPRELAIYLGPPPAVVTQRLKPNPTYLGEHQFEARV